MDPFKIREMNIVHEGDVMPAYYGAVNTSCTLDRCLAKVHEMINWDEKYPRRDMGNGKIRAVGMGMAMQGSGISGMDVGSATLKVNDEGFYTLLIVGDLGRVLVIVFFVVIPQLLPQSGNLLTHVHNKTPLV